MNSSGESSESSNATENGLKKQKVVDNRSLEEKKKAMLEGEYGWRPWEGDATTKEIFESLSSEDKFKVFYAGHPEYTPDQMRADMKKLADRSHPDYPEYFRQVEENVFDLNVFPPNCALKMLDLRGHATPFIECANIALDQHNKETNSSYELVKIIRGIGDPRSIVKYITFTAKDALGTATFQSKIEHTYRIRRVISINKKE